MDQPIYKYCLENGEALHPIWARDDGVEGYKIPEGIIVFRPDKQKYFFFRKP